MAGVATFRSVCWWNRNHLLSSLWNRCDSVAKREVLSLASVPLCDQASSQYHLPVPCAKIHMSAATHAGHNKWSKVKHIKGPKDTAKSQMFAKLSIMIRFAVKEGGPNPEFNTQLANLIEQCRAKNMPKASIEAAIKGAKSKASVYSLYEARGPGGSSLLIEVLTDNNSRTLQQLKSILNKNGGLMSDGARHCFEKKGVVMVNGLDKNGQDIQLEHALELAIASGAEDVERVEDEQDKVMLKFICDLSSLREVQEKLDALGLLTIHSGPEFIATTTVQLTDGDVEAAFCLIELIDENQDVIKVYDNIELQN
ncbi:translational activator of cytochrome c oxidase 1-like [Pristis pectinata]|uniref:translational activator of cytochrome c oxidase 1-like n=1 Tax=Pristis pectinata TaxID=685728 RepID=UPI00223DBF7F|nr:translational activator of cytochrome c oxidase 1-like [Pristis pectinata]XP_051894878.1 translational activator of cytochrome c oxidase 1-like [Pristis pectinata]XP_051894879.1 translational activator of cytochrome c oxidase 1-like [Pristis pectinata]